MDTLSYLRQFRIFEYAIFDLTVTFLGMALLGPWLSGLFRKLGVEIPRRNWLYLALPLGIASHLAIGQMTLMTKNFLDPAGHYLINYLGASSRGIPQLSK